MGAVQDGGENVKLIDGDALIAKQANIAKTFARSDAQKSLMGRVMYNTEKAPTIDAIPVVRCRDCKFYYGINEECGCNGGYNSEDWYCADGERRDDDALSGR